MAISAEAVGQAFKRVYSPTSNSGSYLRGRRPCRPDNWREIKARKCKGEYINDACENIHCIKIDGQWVYLAESSTRSGYRNVPIEHLIYLGEEIDLSKQKKGAFTLKRPILYSDPIKFFYDKKTKTACFESYTTEEANQRKATIL